MKLTAILLLVACLQVSASGKAQNITLSVRNAPLSHVLEEVEKQTGYTFVYTQNLLKEARPVTVSLRDEDIETALKACLKDQPLFYSIIEKVVIIKARPIAAGEPADALPPPIDVRGRVVDENGQPVLAAVIVKGTKQGTITNNNGVFELKGVDGEATLVISGINIETREVKVGGKTDLQNIYTKTKVSSLNDVTVSTGYWNTTQKMNTGNITKVSGEELNKAPVSNPLAALQGRVPSMVITQQSGVPGSGFKVQIRGRTQVDATVGAGEEPLFIVDGVPMASGNANLNLLQSAISVTGLSGLSPFATINMADIESIEVLKDADATAIYGSRGASGVILITTKKGRAGTTRFDVNVATGISKAPLPDLLSTKDYVAMRKEAFANDNKAMTTANAYDLLVWDTTRDNNLAKQLIGGTARFTSVQASASGGSSLVQYIFGGGFHRETDVFPGELANTRASGHANITSQSTNQKFAVNLIANYTVNKNATSGTDLSMKLTLPPNYRLYDEKGELAWNEGGLVATGMDNPLAYLLQRYDATTNNLNATVGLSYKVSPDLNFRTNVGYNHIHVDEVRVQPMAAQNPENVTTGMTSFGNNNFKSWIVEPQAEYSRIIARGKLSMLAGATLQHQQNRGYSFNVIGYTSDDFLGSLVGVSGSNFNNPSSSDNQYKYAAFFGRLNYAYDSKYILNLSGRRDGSSRFGPNYRFSNFGAVGGAWIFSEEAFMKALPFISYAKLRGSYGVTGNDKIGDYKYIDAYQSYAFYPTYNDSTALTPASLFKPDLHWERNRKLEVGLEAGFLKDGIRLNLAWYRNRSNDPLVAYPLPTTTGFSSVSANLKSVVVENTGFEISLSSYNIRRKDFEWSTHFNITIPENKLLAFPDLEQSSYANRYIVGKPLSIVYIARYTGVDPETGLHTVEDVNKDGKLQVSNTGDLQPLFDMDPKYYGGLQNNLRYKGFDLAVFLQFHNQMNRNWASTISTTPIGAMANVPDVVSGRWQKPGDVTDIQKFTTTASSSSSLSGNTAAYYSSYSYANASYIRFKTVSLGYSLPEALVKKARMRNVSIVVQAQNLFTISPFKGIDPETVFLTRLPPLRTITAGLKVNL